jgi:hypothetical protein
MPIRESADRKSEAAMHMLLPYSDALSKVFLLIQTGLQLTAYLKYENKINQGQTESNVVTWFLWPVLTGALALNYLALADLQSAIMPLISTVWSTRILWKLLQLRRRLAAENAAPRVGTFWKDFNWWERSAVVFGVVGVAVWLWYGRTGTGNYFLLAANIVKFLPLGLDVWKGTKSENALPHLFWMAAGMFWLIEVALESKLPWPEHAKPGTTALVLLYPALFITVHTIFSLLGYRQRILGLARGPRR